MAITPQYEFAEFLRFAEQRHFCGDYELAKSVYQQASQICPESPAPHVRLAQIIAAEGRVRDALSYLNMFENRVEPDAEFHFQKGFCLHLLGDQAAATACFEACLSLNPDRIEAHKLLSTYAMPGPDYQVVLTKLHETVRPRVYLEIGIEQGRTLQLAKHSGIVIGVDPKPLLHGEPPAHFKIFPQTSDDFFADSATRELLTADPIDMSFIDGLHDFAQVIKDFFNVEAYCRPEGVVILHDVIPLNAATSTKERQTMFWSGDVWKALPALRSLCPGLEIQVLAAHPTGIAIITKLQPGREVDPGSVDRVVERCEALSFDEAAEQLKAPKATGESIAEAVARAALLAQNTRL